MFIKRLILPPVLSHRYDVLLVHSLRHHLEECTLHVFKAASYVIDAVLDISKDVGVDTVSREGFYDPPCIGGKASLAISVTTLIGG